MRYTDPVTGKERRLVPDAGWSYNPGEAATEWQGLIDAARDRVSRYAAMVGAAGQADLRALVDRDWRNWLSLARSGEQRNRLGWLGVLTTTDLALLKAEGIDPVTAEVMVRPGLVKGPKADRHEKAGDAFQADQWQNLPELFARAEALLLDTRSRKPIYLLPGEPGRPQLAVKVDYRTGRPKRTMNVVVSAYRANLEDIQRRIESGGLKLLRGRVE